MPWGQSCEKPWIAFFSPTHFPGALKFRPKWVGGYGVWGLLGRPSGWVGPGFGVFCAELPATRQKPPVRPCGPTKALRVPKGHQIPSGCSTK